MITILSSKTLSGLLYAPIEEGTSSFVSGGPYGPEVDANCFLGNATDSTPTRRPSMDPT